MSNWSGRQTIEYIPPPALVVVGGPPALVSAGRNAAEIVGCRLVECSVPDAANEIAVNRPFAILVSQSLLDFDASEFEALARDVSAQLIPVVAVDREQAEIEGEVASQVGFAFRAHTTS